MKKKLIFYLVVFTLLIFPSYKVTANSTNLNSKKISLSKKNVCNKINKMDELIDERTNALINGDYDSYNVIDKKLKIQGTEEITLNQIIALTDNSYNNSSNSINMRAYTRSVSNIKFEKTVYNYKYTDGKTYNIMIITATPKSEGLLYKTGSTTVINSKSAAANTMKFINIGVSSVAGLKSQNIAVVQTVYSAIKGITDQLKSTSTITSIKANYTWNTAETCSFIYVYDKNLGSYRLGARYHKVSNGVGVSIPVLAVRDNGFIAVVKQRSYSGSAIPKNYGSVNQAISYFKKQATYTSSVNSITIKGIEGKNIKTIKLANPQNPSEAGYY